MDKLDVDALVPWESRHGSVKKGFEQHFSLKEKIESTMSPTGASMGVDPHFDARQDLQIIGHMVDNGVQRGILQLEDQSEALTVDIVKYRGRSAWCKENVDGLLEKAKPVPIVFLRYAHHKQNGSNIHDVLRWMMKTMPSVGAQTIKCASQQEMDTLKAYFMENTKNIPDQLRNEIERNLHDRDLLRIPASRTSYASLLLKPEDADAPKHKCARCGAPSRAACSRCKSVHYCSKECQKAEWKDHKKECVSPEQAAQTKAQGQLTKTGAASSNKGLDQPWVDISQSGRPQLFTSTISVNQTTFNSLSPRIQDQREDVFDDSVPRDVKITIKVQIHPGSRAADSQPLMIYPQGKPWHLMAYPANTVGGQRQYARLHHLVSSRGLGMPGNPSLGGLKAYLDAYVTQDGKLRVMLDNVHPLQRW